MRPIGCPKTSVQNYHSALRNVPEECRSQVKEKLKLSCRSSEYVFITTDLFFINMSWWRLVSCHTSKCALPMLFVSWSRRLITGYALRGALHSIPDPPMWGLSWSKWSLSPSSVFSVTIILPMLHAHISFIYHRWYIMFATNSIFKQKHFCNFVTWHRFISYRPSR